MLAGLLLTSCAEPSSTRYRNLDPMADLANTCAMCGATVSGDYFANTTLRSLGPGNY